MQKSSLENMLTKLHVCRISPSRFHHCPEWPTRVGAFPSSWQVMQGPRSPSAEVSTAGLAFLHCVIKPLEAQISSTRDCQRYCWPTDLTDRGSSNMFYLKHVGSSRISSHGPNLSHCRVLSIYYIVAWGGMIEIKRGWLMASEALLPRRRAKVRHHLDYSKHATPIRGN